MMTATVHVGQLERAADRECGDAGSPPHRRVAHQALAAVESCVDLARHRTRRACVVEVPVREHDVVELPERHPGRLEPRLECSNREPRVEQHVRVARAHERGVSLTAASEDLEVHGQNLSRRDANRLPASARTVSPSPSESECGA